MRVVQAEERMDQNLESQEEGFLGYQVEELQVALPFQGEEPLVGAFLGVAH